MPCAPESADEDMGTAERAFFADALSAFVKSKASFEVVCSLTGSSHSSLPSQPPQRPPSRVQTLVVLDSSFNPPTLAHMKMATTALQTLRTAQAAAATIAPGGPPKPSPLRLLLLLAVNNADKAPKPAVFEQRLALMLALARDMHDHLRNGEEGASSAIATAPSPFSSDNADDDSGLPPIDIGLTALPYFHEKSNAIAAAPFYAWPEAAAAPATTTPEQIFLIGYDTLIRIFDPKYYPAPPANTPPLPADFPTDASPMQIALTPLMRRARLHVTVRPDDQWGDARTQQAWLQQLPTGQPGGRRGPGSRGGDNWAAKIDLVPAVAVAQGAEAVSSTAARAAAAAQDWGRLEALVGPHVAAWVKGEKLYQE